MYSFFALSGSRIVRTALAAVGSLLITAAVMASAIVLVSPTATLTTGVLA